MTPQQKDTLAAIAVALLLAQTAERVIRLCMTFVLQKSSPLTLEMLEHQEKAERRKTLGYFLTELRKRADLAPGLDELLEDFLRRRNLLVHEIGGLNEYSLQASAGLANANRFARDTIQVTEKVLKIFVGLVRAWQEQIGMGPDAPGGEVFFEEIESKYKPLVNELFFSKANE